MGASDHLQVGDLGAALEALQTEIRSKPADAKLRTFLFQLLSVNGDWDRARRQLDVLADIDPGALAMVHTYREALACEALRAEVFAGQKKPLVFGEPEPWIASQIELLSIPDDALRSSAIDNNLAEAPAVSGNINGEPFAWICDADVRLGPALEAVINNKYYWLPFSRLSKLVIEEPVDLRDTVWMPAYFTFANEGETVGLIPTRYAASDLAEESAVRLARQTQWRKIDEHKYEGLGQRVLATDNGDFPLMEIREIVINGEI